VDAEIQTKGAQHLQQEIARSRFFVAAYAHLRDDLGVRPGDVRADWALDFTLHFGLAMEDQLRELEKR